METATRAVADRYFGGVVTDAIRASLSFLSWTLLGMPEEEVMMAAGLKVPGAAKA